MALQASRQQKPASGLREPRFERPRTARPSRQPASLRAAQSVQLDRVGARLEELRWLQSHRPSDELCGRLAYMGELRACLKSGINFRHAPGTAWRILSPGPAGFDWAKGVTLEARRWHKAPAPRHEPTILMSRPAMANSPTQAL